MKILRVVLAVLAGLLAIISFLPWIPTDTWWIRMMDAPRLQLMALDVVVAIVTGLFATFGTHTQSGTTRTVLYGVTGALAVASLLNAFELYPYLPGSLSEDSCPDEQQIHVVIANVLLENRDPAPLIALIRREDPDLLFALDLPGRARHPSRRRQRAAC